MPARSAGSILALMMWGLAVLSPQIAASQGIRQSAAQAPQDRYQGKEAAIRRLPLDRLTPHARNKVLAVVQSPTLFRQLPSQTIDCDPQMFVFLVRHPEVLVGIWDVMGVTKVQTQRIAPYQLEANDHVGTECVLDLVYGDARTHLFLAGGTYSGPLSALPISGSGVFVLHSQYVELPDGRMRVTGSLDCFVQLDSLGADLLARTLAGVIGRTADSNFRETARFIAQVSDASERNPEGVRSLAERLPQVEPAIRSRFAEQAAEVGRRAATDRAASSDSTVNHRSASDGEPVEFWK